MFFPRCGMGSPVFATILTAITLSNATVSRVIRLWIPGPPVSRIGASPPFLTLVTATRALSITEPGMRLETLSADAAGTEKRLAH